LDMSASVAMKSINSVLFTKNLSWGVQIRFMSLYEFLRVSPKSPVKTLADSALGRCRFTIANRDSRLV
jgi:hypothetical protein